MVGVPRGEGACLATIMELFEDSVTSGERHPRVKTTVWIRGWT